MAKPFDEAVNRLKKRCLRSLIVLLLSCAAFVLYKAELIPDLKGHPTFMNVAILVGFVSFGISFTSAVMLIYYNRARKILQGGLDNPRR